MKMADVEALVKAKQKMHKPNTVASLEKLWINAVFEEQGSMVVMKGVERNQLKMLLKLWPNPDAVMARVLKSWTHFAAKVATDAGAKDTPAQPSIGFLLKYAAIAVIYAEPKKHEAPKVFVPHYVSDVQSIAQKDEHQPATLEETLALLKGQNYHG